MGGPGNRTQVPAFAKRVIHHPAIQARLSYEWTTINIKKTSTNGMEQTKTRQILNSPIMWWHACLLLCLPAKHEWDSGGFKPPLSESPKNSDYAHRWYKLSARLPFNSYWAPEFNCIGLRAWFFLYKKALIFKLLNPKFCPWWISLQAALAQLSYLKSFRKVSAT